MLKTFIDTSIDVRKLEAFAIDKYVECPKYITIVRHGDLVDTSEFFCTKAFVGPVQPGTYPSHRYFQVPKQSVIMADDVCYGLFSISHVMDEEGHYWLVVSEKSGIGFLLAEERFTFNASPYKTKQREVTVS